MAASGERSRRLEEDALRAFVMHGFGHQHGLSVIQWGFSGRLIGYYDPARPGQELGLEDTFHIPGLGLSLHRVADDVQVVAVLLFAQGVRNGSTATGAPAG